MVGVYLHICLPEGYGRGVLPYMPLEEVCRWVYPCIRLLLPPCVCDVQYGTPACLPMCITERESCRKRPPGNLERERESCWEERPPGDPERRKESCWEESLPAWWEEGGYLVLPCPVPWWPYYPVYTPPYTTPGTPLTVLRCAALPLRDR